MNATNPIHWSADELIALGPDTIHELACKAAGTINSYHIVVGRCLLAAQRSELYKQFGCSGAIHYGTSVLGLETQTAQNMRRVAQALESLPLLSRAGEAGEVDWSKLREVVRKATPETEAFWLEVCSRTYREVVRLVRSTPLGGIPGDLPGEAEREPAVTALRLQLGLEARETVERGLQLFSLRQGRPVPLAEAIESLFAQVLAKETVSADELADLAKSQAEARKDLLAAHYREQPIIQEARGLAEALGLVNPQNKVDDTRVSEFADLPLADIYIDLLETAHLLTNNERLEDKSSEDKKCETADTSMSGRGEEAKQRGQEIESTDSHPYLEEALGLIGSSERDAPTAGLEAMDEGRNLSGLIAARPVSCPGNDAVQLLARWRNPRLAWNPENRLPTAAQRREILRRDGYRCSTPGCNNHLWLEVHHKLFHSHDGKTVSDNLLTLCSGCHTNVHEGLLFITGEAPDKLVFTDRHGNDLSRTHKLGVAGWLDFWTGWSGGREDSHLARMTDSHSGDEALFVGQHERDRRLNKLCSKAG